MIKFHLKKLLREKYMTQTDLCNLTGIRPGTINLYYHGYAKRLNVNDIDKICDVLNCNVNDLIEHIKRK